MTTFDPGHVLDHWVNYSALLDIWQDEEEPALDDLRTFGSERGLPEQALSQFLDWLPSGKNVRSPSEDSTAEGVSRFFALKRLRVWAILRFDRTCFDLANEVATCGGWSHLKSHLKRVREAKKRRREALDKVFLECAAALRHPPKRSTGRSDHLRALWHTELCATSPDESTLGLVRAFPLPESVPKIFRDIAKHNTARSRSHLHQHDDAVKVLESLADDAANGTTQDPTILRLVGFPALASMADALTHLLRHVEARWYWTQGIRLASGTSPYWQRFFKTKLADSRAERPNLIHGGDERPKLESLLQEATRKALEEAWRTKTTTLDGGECDSWLRTVYWKLAWHTAESRELLKSLEGTMEDLRSIAEIRKRALDRPGNVLNRQAEVGHLERALCAARACLLECATKQASWLHPDPTSTTHRGFTEPEAVMLTWGPIWKTYRALEEVKKLNDLNPLDTDLEKWLTTLRQRVKESSHDFSRVVPAVELEQLIEASTVKCLANPDGQRNPDCPDCGCPAYSLLPLPKEATEAAPRDDPRRPPLARLEYVLATMARSAAEFNRYLSGRTAEKIDDERKRTPNIEFISLRRWNSFSPNLGSLAADTVGGGYLLRVWTGTSYLGIAIDPGYNFLENLFNEGLTIADVDLVAVTHAHPDHTDSITNLLTLVRESKKRVLLNPKNTIRFAMSAGVLERYQNFLQAEVEFIPEVVMLSWAPAPGNAASQSKLAIRASTKPDGLSIDFIDVVAEGKPLAYIEAIRAHHEDGTQQDSIGFKISIPASDRDGHYQKELVVGILGDSRYHPLLKDKLLGCDVVVLHLGAMLEDHSYRDTTEAFSMEAWCRLCHLHGTKDPTCSKQQKKCAQAQLHKLLKKNHLYWTGATKLICDLLPTPGTSARSPAPLVVLSEFGEELRGGLRADLARRLEGHFWNLRPEVSFPGVIPADVGLRIDVAEKRVRCAVCERYWTWKEMDAIAVRPADEGLSFVCRDCQSLREHELGEILSRRRAQVRVP